MPRGEVVIDPFTGQSLSRDDLEERLAPYRRQRGLVGDFDVPLGLFLQTSSPRETLARLLRNLKEIYRAAGSWGSLLAVQQRLVILLPEHWDRGYVTEAALAAMRHGEQVLGLGTILGITSPHNVRSIAVLGKLGLRFVEEKSLGDKPQLLKIFALALK